MGRAIPTTSTKVSPCDLHSEWGRGEWRCLPAILRCWHFSPSMAMVYGSHHLLITYKSSHWRSISTFTISTTVKYHSKKFYGIRKAWNKQIRVMEKANILSKWGRAIIHKLLTDKLKHPRKCSNSKIPADEKLVQTSILRDQRAWKAIACDKTRQCTYSAINANKCHSLGRSSAWNYWGL